MKPLRIVILAKAPRSGLAKTRLIPLLGEQGAAKLAQRLLDATIKTALAAKIGKVECCVTPDPDNAVWAKQHYPQQLIWSAQIEGDLGARMAMIARRVINKGESVLLIGTDCPSLTEAHLQMAASALEKGNEACMIPAKDGGYALLGLSKFDHIVFSGIAWSSARVAQQTRDKVTKLGWQMPELATLQDIDNPQDLSTLPACFLDGIPLR